MLIILIIGIIAFEWFRSCISPTSYVKQVDQEVDLTKKSNTGNSLSQSDTHDTKCSFSKYKLMINKALEKSDIDEVRKLLTEASQFVLSKGERHQMNEFIMFESEINRKISTPSDSDYNKILSMLEQQDFSNWYSTADKLLDIKFPHWFHDRLMKKFYNTNNEDVKVKILRLYQRAPWGHNKHFILSVVLKDTTAGIREEAARILHLGNAGPRPFNIDLSDNELLLLFDIYKQETDPKVKKEILYAFKKVYIANPAAEELLKSEAQRGNLPQLRSAAVDFFPLDKPDFIDIAISLLNNDKLYTVRSSAGDYLSRVFKEISSRDLKTIKHLELTIRDVLVNTILNDSDSRVRLTLVRSVSFLNDPPVEIKTALEFIKRYDSDAEVRSKAERILNSFYSDENFKRKLPDFLRNHAKSQLQQHELKFGKNNEYFELEKRLKEGFEADKIPWD